jgi:hypothetical protein
MLVKIRYEQVEANTGIFKTSNEEVTSTEVWEKEGGTKAPTGIAAPGWM